MKRESMYGEVRGLGRAAAVIMALWLAGNWNPAQAQQGAGRGQKLGPEKLEAAWAAEAGSVAKDLKITGDAAAKLTDAYKAARKSHREAVSAQRKQSQGQDRATQMQAMNEVKSKEVAKLQAALTGKLDEAQVKAAMVSLGSFNQRWDDMANALLGFKLDEAKQGDALKLVKGFIEAVSKGEASSREENQKLRAKLDDDLKPLLSAEQLTEWKSATTQQRRERGGRGSRGAGGGGEKKAPKADK